MFKKTSLQLTAIYLSIIMTISLAFSVSLYQVSIREIDRGLREQSRFLLEKSRFRSLFGGDTSLLIDNREETFDIAKQRLISKLIITNLAILAGGGLFSYILARRSLKPIEEIHNAQSRFTADASHELRTPIATMQTETEVTLMEPNLTIEQAKEQLKSNLEELSKLTALSEDLLKLARLENNPLDMQENQIVDIIKNVINRVSLRAEHKNISIISSVPENVTIDVDANLIEDALVTVLDNAIKYSPKKSQIKLTAKERQKSIQIAVKDNGPGIDAKDLPHIFERFYRADQARSKNQSKGYGLGLAIAKNIIDLHEGSIKAISKKNQGTTITINLPKKY